MVRQSEHRIGNLNEAAWRCRRVRAYASECRRLGVQLQVRTHHDPSNPKEGL